MKKVLIISEKDNLATTLVPIKVGETLHIDNQDIIAQQNIPKFHKIAIHNIFKGEPCYKYGQIIGVATTDIQKGDYVHIHNLESCRGRGDNNLLRRSL
ncbi:SAF_AH_GD [Peptoniphilus sp. ING2-D1G]|nr:SAF_AH_GD [Peptoniphilus sp. ING2-D1G]